MKRLLYRRGLQRKAGEVTRRQQRGAAARKDRTCDAARTASGVVEACKLDPVETMMQSHFRDVMNPGAFYSLPESLLRRTKMQTLASALVTSQHECHLPPSAPKRLAIQPASSASPSAQVHQPALPYIQMDEEDGEVSQSERVDSCGLVTSTCSSSKFQTPVPVGQGFQLAETTALQQVFDEAANSTSNMFFRVTDQRLHLKKRPLSGSDNVTNLDFSIRLYRVSEQHEANSSSVVVYESSKNDIALARLFACETSDSAAGIVDHMVQWTVLPGMHKIFHKPTCWQSLSKGEQQLLSEILDSNALIGSCKVFHTDGLNRSEELALANLVKTGLVTWRTGDDECGEGQAQVLSTLLSHGLLLQSPQPVFTIRPTAPFKYTSITKAVRPTLFEVYLKLKKDGWKEKRGERNVKRRYYCANDGGEAQLRLYFPPLRFWYGIALINARYMANDIKIQHGQLEAYYVALLHAAFGSSDLPEPNRNGPIQ